MLDAYAAAADVRARRRSPVELVEAALTAIATLDPQLGAFTVVLADEARAAAQAVERAASAGAVLGPLAGVPVAIKDHVWMRGAPATNGSLALADFIPDGDALSVARLRAAGAVLVGKTNNPEFCYRGITDNALFGLTRNPWDLERTPGGSSGGSAAAVAAGMVPLALGTDGGGSIRIPASFCGIAGHKPTFGLVPKEPGFKNWHTLSVHGPLARSVRDLALMLQVMAGPAREDELTWPVAVGDLVGAVERADVAGRRVAWSADLGFAPVEPDVREAFGGALDALAGVGWELVEAQPPPRYPTAIWNTIATAEGYASEGPLLTEWESRMTDGVAELVRAGERISAGEYIDAQHERAGYTRAWSAFFETYDLLLTPAMQLTALPIGILAPEAIDGQPIDPFFDDWCTFCYPANLTGQPAASVPIGHGADGLPVGVQIMGRRWDDALVLAAAAAVEQALPWADRWPPFSRSPTARARPAERAPSRTPGPPPARGRASRAS
jgi:Asp-tRNA(Asn)/Glu-tRNA(Gln) amidotransferase A subunit family amidase